MRDTGFAREFKKLIVGRIEELVSDAQRIADSQNVRDYKIEKLDEKLGMIKHNFKCYAMFFKVPYGQKESILESLETLYRIH